MAWAIETSTDTGPLAWAQWVDRPKAEGWLARLRALLAAPRPTATDGLARTLGLAEAVGNFYRACDLVPFADPAYVGAWVRADRGSPFSGPSDWLGFALQVFERYSPAYRAAVRDPGRTVITDLVRRVQLNGRGELVGQDAAGSMAAPATPRGIDRENRTCGGPPAPWDCWLWSEWEPSWASADRDTYFAARVPLFLHFDLFEQVARTIVEAGVTGVVVRARRWCIVKNLRTARGVGLSGSSELRAALADEELERLTADPDVEEIAGLGPSLVGLAALAGATIVAPFFLVVAGAPALLFEAFGRASGRSVDVFGRNEPLYETPYISGSFAPNIPPTQEVPSAPSSSGSGRNVPWLFTPLVIPRPNVEVLGVRRGSGSGALVGLGALALLLLSSEK